MDTLSKLFSSKTLVKVMRLFLFHPDDAFDAEDIAKLTKSRKTDVTAEMRLLVDIDFARKKEFTKVVELKTGTREKRARGWTLNSGFPYIEGLEQMLVDSELIEAAQLKRELRKIGNMQLIVLSGVFTRSKDAPIDLLLVANKIKKGAADKVVSSIENVVGTELSYTLISPEELKYRLQVRDRLMRDLFSSPYSVLLNTRRFVLPEVGTL